LERLEFPRAGCREFLEDSVAPKADEIQTLPGAGEVVAVVQTAMLAGLPYTKLYNTILAHPMMVEGLGSLFSNVPPRSGQ
jgi:hypothetical protein